MSDAQQQTDLEIADTDSDDLRDIADAMMIGLAESADAFIEENRAFVEMLRANGVLMDPNKEGE